MTQDYSKAPHLLRCYLLGASTVNNRTIIEKSGKKVKDQDDHGSAQMIESLQKNAETNV